MISADHDAFVCDLAETYGIFDYRALPVQLLATLAAGLREDSRIKLRLSGGKLPRSELLLAAAVDRLSLLVWFMSKEGTERPKSILDILLDGEPEEKTVVAFETAEDYEAEWKRLTGVGHG